MFRLSSILFLVVTFCSLAFAHASGMGSSNYTNSPPILQTCISCHSGHALNSGTGLLTIGGLPTGGYVPNQTYNVIINLSQSNMYRWGFQQTTQLTSNSALGGGHLTSSNPNASATIGSTGPDYANQTSIGTFAGTMNGPVTWYTTWQAPPAGSGTVAFYTVGLAANNNNSSSGDYAYARRDTVREILSQLPPNQFSLLSPANYGFIPNGAVTFTWQMNGDPNPGDSVSYKLFWSLDSTFFNFDSTASVTTGSIQLNLFSQQHRYFWKVRAIDNHGNARWCTQYFEFDYNVSRPPNPFALLSPADTSLITSLPVVFQWHSTIDLNPGDTVTYTLMKSFYWDEMLFDTLYSGSDTTYSWNGAIDDSTYKWSVVASDQHGNKTWATSENTFTYFVPTPPTGTITLTSPADSVTVPDPMILFTWTTITDPDPGDTPTYTIWLQQGTDSISFDARSVPMLVVTLTDWNAYQPNLPVTWWVVGHSLYPPTDVYSLQRNTLLPVNGVIQRDLIPASLRLMPAYPNPFNSTTHLLLMLPYAAKVSGVLYNISGQAVANFQWGIMGVGAHNIELREAGLSSGRFILRCRVANQYLMQSFTLLK